MRGLVINAGQTKGTQCVAETIYDSLLLDKKLCTLQELADDPRDYDVVFVGFDMKHDEVNPEIKAFLEGLYDVRVALFGTMDDTGVNDATYNALWRNQACLSPSVHFLGGYVCRNDESNENCIHPTAGDLLGAQEFTKDIYYSLRS